VSTVSLTVNGKSVTAEVEDRTLLVQLLRDHLGLTGTHVGCDTSQCGACIVHIDGRAVKSCTTLVGQANGANVTTIEGIAGKEAAAVQKAWVALDVPQCGYCQSGQVMSAAALLARNPKPTDRDIDLAMTGNICRCATYVRIRAAIHGAAKSLEG